MATYSFNAKIVKRSEGKRATGAAAYIVRAEIKDERTGEMFSYASKAGLIHAEVMLPEGAPDGLKDVSRLSNDMEWAEKRSDAQVGYRYIIALPHELTNEQNIELARGYVKDHFTDKGIPVVLGIHEPDAQGDSKNVHMHLLVAMRTLDEDGRFSATKYGYHEPIFETPKMAALLDRIGELADNGDPQEIARLQKQYTNLGNQQARTEDLTALRAGWAVHASTALHAAGHDISIDHRSYEAQGIDKIPGVHLGPSATAMEREGISTEVGNKNRQAKADNAELDRIYNQELRRLDQGAGDMSGISQDKAEIEREVQETVERQKEAWAQQKAVRDAADAYIKEREREAELEKKRQLDQKANAEAKVQADALPDPNARWLAATARHYNARDPYGSLGNVAVAEGAAVAKEMQEWNEKIAEANPEDRPELEAKRNVVFWDYKQAAEQRVHGIITTTVDRSDERAVQVQAKADDYGRNAKLERDKLAELVKDRVSEKVTVEDRLAAYYGQGSKLEQVLKDRNEALANGNGLPTDLHAGDDKGTRQLQTDKLGHNNTVAENKAKQDRMVAATEGAFENKAKTREPDAIWHGPEADVFVTIDKSEGPRLHDKKTVIQRVIHEGTPTYVAADKLEVLPKKKADDEAADNKRIKHNESATGRQQPGDKQQPAVGEAKTREEAMERYGRGRKKYEEVAREEARQREKEYGKDLGKGRSL